VVVVAVVAVVVWLLVVGYGSEGGRPVDAP
jgi:hypothetical protein